MVPGEGHEAALNERPKTKGIFLCEKRQQVYKVNSGRRLGKCPFVLFPPCQPWMAGYTLH